MRRVHHGLHGRKLNPVSEIRRLEDLDAEVRLDLAYDFYRVV